MNSLVLLIVGIIVFLTAYICYGGYLVKKWGLDKSRKTPAVRLCDNTDYVPTDVHVLFGHHFSSIAGAGPITGPILAAAFGWLPAYLWILIGSTFFGGVHDFGSLAASLDNDGKSIGEIIKSNVSPKAQKIFNWYAWLTLGLVVAAFADMCAKTFAYTEGGSLVGAQSGTASVIFIILAVIFGIVRNRFHANLAISTIAGVILIIGAIMLGYFCPVLKFSAGTWNVILIIYICLASVSPVWLLLQPRDYLCSFLLYAMIAGAFIGVFIQHPTIELTAFGGFTVPGKGTLFPILFVTIACGAISGFHSLVSSGTTSKQLENDKDAKAIGYGSMLVEGILAIIALITVAYVSKDGITFADGGKSLGTPVAVFSNGVASFMNKFGIPVDVGKVFVSLAYSAFALTSLDTATRIDRYLMQEMGRNAKKQNAVTKLCANKYVATLLTILLSIALLIAGYIKIWPIFGAANQLLAALALLAISSWMLRRGKKTWETIFPCAFMFVVTLSAIVILTVQHIKSFIAQTSGGVVVKNSNPWIDHLPLCLIGAALSILAIMVIVESVNVLSSKKQTK